MDQIFRPYMIHNELPACKRAELDDILCASKIPQPIAMDSSGHYVHMMEISDSDYQIWVAIFLSNHDRDVIMKLQFRDIVFQPVYLKKYQE